MYKYKSRVFKAIGTIDKESQPSGRKRDLLTLDKKLMR